MKIMHPTDKLWAKTVFGVSYLEGGGWIGREGRQGEMGLLPPRGETHETGRVLYGRPVSATCTWRRGGEEGERRGREREREGERREMSRRRRRREGGKSYTLETLHTPHAHKVCTQWQLLIVKPAI